MMLKKIIRVLKGGPLTTTGIEANTGIPKAIVRSVLMSEMYMEKEVFVKDIGKMIALVPNPSSRIRLDAAGRYYLLTTSSELR